MCVIVYSVLKNVLTFLSSAHVRTVLTSHLPLLSLVNHNHSHTFLFTNLIPGEKCRGRESRWPKVQLGPGSSVQRLLSEAAHQKGHAPQASQRGNHSTDFSGHPRAKLEQTPQGTEPFGAELVDRVQARACARIDGLERGMRCTYIHL